jgi:hypothetical protein
MQKILKVISMGCDFCRIEYDYKEKENRIIVKFEKHVPKGRIFSIITKTYSGQQKTY